MDKFFRKTKGAISIFLVIVLLPMLTVASVFVDMSRLNLARSMAESAGDLALNTALTNYDSEMKNIYGLFATSQDMDELMANLEDYYRDSIVAAGVDSAAADDYVGQIMDYLKTTTGSDDLMNIALSEFEVSAPTGGNLGNPAILKSQIVEFMKYRAPLSLGSGLIEALTSMKDLSKQTTLVEKKNDFYEAHQDLLGTLEDAWWQMELYQYKDATSVTGFPTGSYLTDQGSAMATNANQWKNQSIVKDTVKYLYRYGSFKNLLTGKGKLQYEIILEYKCAECGMACAASKSSCTACQESLVKDLEHQQWKLTWGGVTTVVKSSYTMVEPATVDEVVQWLNAVLNAIDGVDSYTTGKYSTGYKAAATSTSASTVERVYAVCIFNDEISKSTNYFTKVKTLLQAMVNLEAALETCSKTDLETTKVTQINGGNYKIETGSGTPLANFAYSNLNSHLNLKNGGYLDMFNQTVSRVNGHYSATSATVEQALENVPARIDAIRDQAAKFDAKLGEKITNLSKAITLLNSVSTALTDTNSEYYKALDAWKTSANNLSENTMGKNDLAEMEDLTSIITTERISSLVTRLTNAKKTLEAIREEVAKFKIAGTSWKDIKDNVKLADVQSLFSSYDSQIKGVVPTGDNSYDTVINTILGTVTQGSITNTWGSSESSPNLVHQQRELYTWLCNNFYQEGRDYATTTETNEMTSGDGDVEKMESSLKKQADDQDTDGSSLTESTKVDREVTIYYKCPSCKALNKKGTKNCSSCNTAMIQTAEYVSGTLPSTAWAEVEEAIAQGKVETNADTLMGDKDSDNFLAELLELATNMGRDMRDNLYVSEYIMTMFSYNTIERETYVKEKGNSDGYKAFWTADDSGTYTETADMKQYAAKIETLTKNSINPGMNYLYGEEVEYILYGENGAEKVYGTIFVLRFALNTVYAFTDAEINSITMSAATALFGTPPLTPLIPLAKAAMIIGLAIAESAWDLFELRQGEAVPLMKSKETWVMSPSGLASEVKNVVIDKSKEAAYKLVDEGYKVLNEAIAMTSEELQAIINAGGDELKNLASSATKTVKDKIYNKANEAVQKVVDYCHAANQEAMLEVDYSGLGSTPDKVSKVVTKINTWLSEQSQDDAAIYQAKQIAVQYLTANDGKVISDIFNKIEEQSNASSNSATAKTADAATDATEATDAASDYSSSTILGETLNNIQTKIVDKIDGAIDQGTGALNQAVSDIEQKVMDAAAEGAEELKNTLGNYIDSAFSGVAEAPPKTEGASSTMASLLSWRYSDYLRVFVLIGLMANEEALLLRMADMIELNMQNNLGEFAVITTTETVTTTKSRFFGLWKTTTTKDVEKNTVNDKAFSLSKSYTYLTITAKLQVKPLLMTLPFMADTVENQLSGTNWYEIEYKGTSGY